MAQRQLVLRQGAGLVGTQHVHAGQFLDGDQLAHDRLLLGEQARADCHRHRQNRGHRHGDRRHGQHQGELQQSEDRVAAIDSNTDDHRHHGHRQHDQVVADPQHGFLEMADGNRRLHQFRRLAEIGFLARRIDQRTDLAATNDRTGEYGVAGFARGGQRFARQRRLIDGNLVAVQQTRICRHDVAQAQADGVARHQFPRRRGDPFSIAFHPGLNRQPGLQGLNGVALPGVLPRTRPRRWRQAAEEDDEKVGPVPDHARQNHRHFDHPRDGTPEIGEEFQERIGLLLLDLVGAILGQPFLRLGLRETVRRRPQFFLHLRQGQGFQILCAGLRTRLGFGTLRLGGIGFHDGHSFCRCLASSFATCRSLCQLRVLRIAVLYSSRHAARLRLSIWHRVGSNFSSRRHASSPVKTLGRSSFASVADLAGSCP
jgi:hypothetical protein